MSFDRDALRAELSHDEGRRARVYLDSVGVPTIGVGWNLEANALPGDVIDRLLDVSIDQAVATLDLIDPRWRVLNDERQRVLINMAFNLGHARLSGFTKFWEAMRDYFDGKPPFAQNLTRAADEMLASKWAQQVGARAVRLADRMRVQK